MSTNVSLGDTPGVSAYFDGQPIQDQQEAELRREEERQEKELRRLLETELEDFEDDEDFLSGSNSEDDGGNQSSTSGQHSIRSSMDFHASNKDGALHVPNHTVSRGFPGHGIVGSPVDSRTSTKIGAQQPFGNEQDPSFARSEPKSPAYIGHMSPYPPAPGQAGSRSPLDPRQFLGGRVEDLNPSSRGFIQDCFSPGHRQNQLGMFPTAAVPNNVLDDASLSSLHITGEHVSKGEAQTRNFRQFDSANPDVRQSKDFESGGEQKNLQESDYLSLNARQVAHSGTGGTANSNINIKSGGAAAEDDEWMMKIQTAAAPSHHHHHQQQQHHHRHHPHHYHQQLQHQYNQPFASSSSQTQQQQQVIQQEGHKYHHRVPVAVASGFYTKTPQGIGSNPPHSSAFSSPNPFSTVPSKYPHQQGLEHYHQPNHLENHHFQQQQQQLRQEVSNSPPPPPLPSTLPPSLPPSSQASSVLPSVETQYKLVHNKQPTGNVPEDDSQYKVVYNNQNSIRNGEEQFYLTNDQTEFFNKDGPEDQMKHEQLEILYRARGREVEELKRKLEENEAESGREKRTLKHRAAVAEGEVNGTNESLKQSQRLLQQAKADNADALGKVAGLEKELSAFCDAKEELVKKLAQAESTIETLTQHVTELSESDSVSRARREHEAVVSTLTQRHQREILVLKEQLDVAKAELTTKTQELSQTREQLGEATLALEQAQVSRGETVNRLSRSLEESQRRCQELLQQLGADGAAREVATLRVKLEQGQESTRISEELCRSYQNELKEAKEQLSMLEAATSLGAISSLSSATSANGRVPPHNPSADDSMTDLGIRRTLDFNSTPQSEGRCDATDDDLVISLRSELERCLRSNREKRSEVTELRGQVKTLSSELEKAKAQLAELGKTCSDQKKRLSELGELMGEGENGLGAVEARLKRDLEKMGRENQALLDDIKDYQQRLEEVGASEAQLTEINAELSQQMSAMVAKGDQDKADALARCQRTMEETGRITLDNMRREIEERHAADIETLSGRGERQLAELKQQLSSALKELDDVKALYVNVCQEAAAQEAELTEKFKQQLEAETQKIKDRVELEKKEWREFIREEIRKEEDEGTKSAETEKLSQLEAELQAKWEKETELKVAQARLETLQEQRKSMEEERQDWEKNKAQMEITLKQRTEEISLLSAQLEAARAEIISLKEKMTELTQDEINRREKSGSHIEASEERDEDENIPVDLEETFKGSDISATEEPGLVSMSIVFSEDEDVTIMKTLQADQTRQAEVFPASSERTADDLPTDSKSRGVNSVDEMETKLREKELDIERLERNLESKCRELDGKGKELEELQQKGRELEEALQQKEAELVEVREKMRIQVAESSQEVDKYRMKITELQTEVEKSRSLIMTHGKDDGSSTANDRKPVGKSDMADSAVVKIGQECDLDPEAPEQLKELVQNLREKLRLETETHEAELARQKDIHRVEFERAARQREEKFQTELRYFLKEREERGKSRTEEAVKECREKCEEELRSALRQREEKVRGDFEISLRDVRKGHEEEKRKLEKDFQIRLEEEQERWRDIGTNKVKDGRLGNTLGDNLAKTQGLTDGGDGDENAASVKLIQAEVNSLTEDLRIERQEKVRLTLLVEEKDGQIVAMALRHEEEEKTVKEKFQREMSELKDICEKQVKRLESELDVQRKKFEDVSKELEISATAKTTVELLRIEAEVEKRLESQVRKAVEEKVRKEMEAEMEGKVKEMEREARSKGINEDYSIKEEVERRLSETIQEERGKWFKDAENYISSEVRRGVEDRLREEEDKRKGGFDKEVEDKVKWRVEEERARLGKEAEGKIKERVKERIDVELSNMKKKFTSELGARIGAEKSRLEQEVSEWKTRATKEIERDREKWRKDMKAKVTEEREKWVRERETQVDRKVAEERKKLEAELKAARDEEIADLRRELEAEMRKRINKEREEWEDEMKEEQRRRGGRKKEGEEEDEDGRSVVAVTVEERLKSEVEVRTKACAERDRAVTYIREREVSYKEERQRLISGLERCRGDLEGMKEEHRELEEKCASMDRRYKEDMKSARRRREEDLHNLRKKLEQEKHDAVASWEEKVRALREECSNAVERARSQGEMEKASLLAEVQRHTERALDKSSLPSVADTDSSTILELRDHYLDTVAKIKADVMSHVQEANSRAAATMRAQIRKQRVKVVEEFKLKVKACLKAALTGEVPTSCVTALENSIDNLAQQLLSSTASSSSSSGNTPRSGHDADKPKVTSDLGQFDTVGLRGSSPHVTEALLFQEEDKDVLKSEKKYRRGLSPKRVSPPQKDTPERVFDHFDTAYDDRGDTRQNWDRPSTNPTSPVVQRLNSKGQRAEKSRASPQLQATHPQLDGVDLFDTSNSQYAVTPTTPTTPPPMTRNRPQFSCTVVSPARKSKSDKRWKVGHQQQQQQPQWLSNVPSSTAGTKGGDTTPVSSNASSPRASPTPTHPRSKSSKGNNNELRLDLDLGQSPFVTLTRGSGERDWDIPSSKLASKGTSKVSKKSSKDIETSPRDQMKRIEARVRLANWAKSGTAPWTSPIKVKNTDPFSGKVDEFDTTHAEDISLEQRTFPWDEEDNGYDGNQQNFSGGGGGAMTVEGFRVPGPEAEKWVRAQKQAGVRKSGYGDRSGKQELSELVDYPGSSHKTQQNRVSDDGIDRQERVGMLKAVVMAEDQFLSSDESVASNGSHSSFVTLKPEEKTLAASGGYKDSVGVTGDRSRGKGLAGSLASQQDPADSGLPRSTRTVDSSHGPCRERGISPYRKERRSNMEDAKVESRSQDYERIRAAMLRGGGDVRDRIDFGTGGDNRGSTTSSDDEMSLEEFRTFPSKSADRYSRPKHSMPTSTPLVKQSLSSEPRAWSEGRVESRRVKDERGNGKGEGKRSSVDVGHFERDTLGSLKDEWRHLGGHRLVESDRHVWDDYRNNHRNPTQNRGKGGGLSPMQSGSLPQHSRRGRSHDQGRRADDLVLRSADQLPLTSSAFPADLSRITQASGKTDDSGPPGMWRYRSLEDLIGGREENSDKLRIYRDQADDNDEIEEREKDDRDRRHAEYRSNSRERRALSANESFGGHSTSTAWYDRGRNGGPIQAMNSEFWERQSSEQDEQEEEEGEEMDRRYRGGKSKSHSHSKMQRSTSEQSLHTLHGTGSNQQGKVPDGVDALLAHYLSPAKSSFDLRPFPREEHF